jgi:hypothetical protein
LNKNTDVVTDQKCERKVLEILLYSVQRLNSPYSYYQDHLPSILEAEVLEYNYTFPWSLDGLDYKNWIETGQKMPVLV